MKQRHNFVDALRGFALLGILVVNAEFIFQSADLGFSQFTEPDDQIVRWLIVAFGQTKIYPLFATLFGYGLSVQIERSQESDLKPRYRRRMLGLVLLGVLHGVLFFPGDILVIYAVIGMAAYRFGGGDSRRLLTIAAWTYGVAAVLWLLIGGLDALGDPSAPSATPESLEALGNGSFLDVVADHTIYWIFTLLLLSAVQGPAVFASFLVGIVLGRTRILADPSAHLHHARRALKWAPVGVVGAGIGATLTVVAGGRWETLGFAVGFAIAPLMTAAYISILALAVGSGGSLIGGVLQATGRMSLSVYLLESVVVSTLSYGYGFGLFGETGPVASSVYSVVVWLALSGFAVLWMSRFRFGPFEWLLRSFTYGERQSLTRQSSRGDRS